jgi:hypothetical protein
MGVHFDFDIHSFSSLGGFLLLYSMWRNCLLAWREENLRVPDDPVKIRTVYVPNRSIEFYHQCVRPLVKIVVGIIANLKYSLMQRKSGREENCGHLSPTTLAPRQIVKHKTGLWKNYAVKWAKPIGHMHITKEDILLWVPRSPVFVEGHFSLSQLLSL